MRLHMQSNITKYAFLQPCQTNSEHKWRHNWRLVDDSAKCLVYCHRKWRFGTHQRGQIKSLSQLGQRRDRDVRNANDMRMTITAKARLNDNNTTIYNIEKQMKTKKNFRKFVILCGILFALVGCNKESVVPPAPPTLTVLGTVTNEDGQPLKSIQVTVFLPEILYNKNEYKDGVYVCYT